MQIKKISATLRPISIAGVLVGSSMLYSDVDQFSDIRMPLSDKHTYEYVQIDDLQRQEVLLSRERFNSLYLSWRNRTMFSSSASEIISDPAFQSILDMGMAAVPYILDTIEREPSTLVWALNKIYGGKISNNPNTTVKEACKLWVKRLKS